MSFTKLSLAVLATTAALGNAYQLVEQHKGLNFYDGFDFFTDADPTHGNVQYQSRSDAISKQLIGVVPSNKTDFPIYMGVDHTSITANRPAVRLTSKKSFNHALVLIDVQHMPSGCGVWPAIWMTGPDWPNSGEIDIAEQVNGNPYNTATLHTSANCAITDSNINGGHSDAFSGTLATTDCDVNSPNQAKNAGCGIRAPENDTYTIGNESHVHSTAGSAFNAQSGGVYAALWTSAGVSIYFFPREYIPSDIHALRPDPSSWTSKPQAVFSGNGCDFDSHLKDLQLVVNTDFCGDWAGNTWEADGCAAKTGVSTCAEYVEKNPKAFASAYWLFNSITVFSNETAGA